MSIITVNVKIQYFRTVVPGRIREFTYDNILQADLGLVHPVNDCYIQQ